MSGGKRCFDNEPDENLEEQPCEERDDVEYENGTIYRGNWQGNVKNGKGVQYWPDGSAYEGLWKMNNACGRGNFTTANGDVFKGIWLND